MRRTGQTVYRTSIAIIAVCVLLLGRHVPAQADSQSIPSLVIAQVKITSSNGQFITLYNTTSTTLDMSKYQLEYFNNFDISKATSSRLIALSGLLPPHGYYMVNDSALQVCHQLTVNSVSLGFSSTAGMVSVTGLSQAQAGGVIFSQVLDYVAWSKTAANDAQTLPANNAFLLRRPADLLGNPVVSGPGSGSWVAVTTDPANPCLFTSVSSPNTPLTMGAASLLPAVEPEVTYIAETTAQPLVNNLGLMAPLITEILPNPTGTGTDGTDEFIELYNPNTVAFDLTGYKLGAGSSTVRTYSFTEGTTLAPKSYTVFNSSQTKLSMSNTSGQVVLLDPADNIIASTKPYTSAADGQAWILNKGQWAWSVKPTPSAPNVLQAPPKKQKKSASSKIAKRVMLSSQRSNTSATKAASGNPFEDSAAKVPVHTWALALVGAAAVVYGLYEYRQDLGSRIRQFGRHLGIGRKNRQQA
jgi:hypothetical protein